MKFKEIYLSLISAKQIIIFFKNNKLTLLNFILLFCQKERKVVENKEDEDKNKSNGKFY